MAEILIKATDHTHPDPEKDRRGAYKRGYPVVVMPDGHQWGREERPPKFVVLKLPRVPVIDTEKYIAADLRQNGVEDDDKTPRMETYRRRLWRMRLDDLPAPVQARLAATGELTIGPSGYIGPSDLTWDIARSYLLNQHTGLPETDDLAAARAG